MIPQAICEAVFHEAVRFCDPARLVRAALERQGVVQPVLGLAVGKAAMAMACGVDSVARGLCITNVVDAPRELPPRWELRFASHPLPDAMSVAAGRAALAFVESASETDTLLVLISGGASSMIEVPAPGFTLDEIRRRTAETMASGASIQELNRVRAELSAIKGGKLAQRCKAPVVTLVISDVPGDDPHVIGSGPTVGPGAGSESRPLHFGPGGRVEVVGELALFGEMVHRALHDRGFGARRQSTPLTGDVLDVAAALAAEQGPLVAWGEPTVRLPTNPGDGGRATQLALALARHLRGSDRSAFVAASDGRDGNTWSAGAYVNGESWDMLVRVGIDPDAELARCNAADTLAGLGAVFMPGPTGINHADVVILG